MSAEVVRTNASVPNPNNHVTDTHSMMTDDLTQDSTISNERHRKLLFFFVFDARLPTLGKVDAAAAHSGTAS